MKRLLLALFAIVSVSVSVFAQDLEQNLKDSIEFSQQREAFMHFFEEQSLLYSVDSLRKEGLYFQALEMLDSYQAKLKKVNGKNPSPDLYTSKAVIYMSLEEWRQLVDVTTECISYNKEIMTNHNAGLIYSLQGSGYRNLGEFKNAIRSYENSFSYYSKDGDLSSQGDVLCSMALCYDELGKYSLASSFYEKGFTKFLQYFNTTKKQLLKKDLRVDDSFKQLALAVLAAHLYNMAVNEQKMGDKKAAKENLLMSVHCGSDVARREYQRVFGDDEDSSFSFN